jgi:hypothetical protein
VELYLRYHRYPFWHRDNSTFPVKFNFFFVTVEDFAKPVDDNWHVFLGQDGAPI